MKFLEQQLQQMQSSQSAKQTQPPSGDSTNQAVPPSTAGTDEEAGFPNFNPADGFYVRNGKNYLRITGQLQADYHGYLNDLDTTDIDTFLIRRARLGIEATVFDYYEFRFLPDFRHGNQPSFGTTFINVHYWDAFQLETGKFKQPISFEEVAIPDRHAANAKDGR